MVRKSYYNTGFHDQFCGICDGFSRLRIDYYEYFLDRFPLRLDCRPSGQALGDGIHPGNLPQAVRRDDRVPDGLQRDGKGFLAFPKFLFRKFPGGDIAHDAVKNQHVVYDRGACAGLEPYGSFRCKEPAFKVMRYSFRDRSAYDGKKRLHIIGMQIPLGIPFQSAGIGG